jgi:hypothetical protein
MSILSITSSRRPPRNRPWRLQGADRVDLGDQTRGAGVAQGFSRALAHITITADDGGLAGHHHVGAAADGVHQAFTAAITVVEFRLGHGVVDVDRREGQLALFGQLIQAHHARGGFFRHALDGGLGFGEPTRGHLDAVADGLEQEGFLFRLRLAQEVRVSFGFFAQLQVHGGVAAIIENHVGGFAVRPMENASAYSQYSSSVSPL